VLPAHTEQKVLGREMAHRFALPHSKQHQRKTVGRPITFARSSLRQESAGGTLALAEVIDAQLQVDELTQERDHPYTNATQITKYEQNCLLSHTPLYNCLDRPRGRITQYNPTRNEVGKNVLRRFKALEYLASKALPRFPDFVLVTRDDDHWNGPLRLNSFSSLHEASKKVFTKNCNQHGGVNDKTLLFGRDAALAILPKLYSGFWDNESTLDQTPTELDMTWNPERYLKTMFEFRGVGSHSVEWQLLPTSTSVYQMIGQSPILCRRPFYDCPDMAAYKVIPVCLAGPHLAHSLAMSIQKAWFCGLDGAACLPTCVGPSFSELLSVPMSWLRRTTQKKATSVLDKLTNACCLVIAEHKDLIPHKSWGNTPLHKQIWWDKHGCNDVVGGEKRSKCLEPAGPSCLEIVDAAYATSIIDEAKSATPCYKPCESLTRGNTDTCEGWKVIAATCAKNCSDKFLQGMIYSGIGCTCRLGSER